MMSAFSYTMHGYGFVYFPVRFCKDDVHKTMYTSSLLEGKHKKKASQNMLPHACDASRFIHL